MGQSQLGPYNSDKSFSVIRFYHDKQSSFSEDINQEFLNNAINFSHWHFMIHQSLIINGYFFSNCKLTLNSSLNHNYSRITLQKENKILTFQHEFERVSNDFRFKQNSNPTNTIIEEVNLNELYKQLNLQQQENMLILDSFGTANSTIQPSINRGRQFNEAKQLFQQSSEEEDFTDFEDKSDSYSPITSRIQENQKNQIRKNHFPSDSDSGQEIHKPNYAQKQSNYQESPLSLINRNKMEDDQQEQELVYQINSELRNLKNKIEKNIGPSYKNLDVSEEYTTNYQKLIEKQRNQKAISTQGNSQQLQQHCGVKYQSNSSTNLNYKNEHPKQYQVNQLIPKEKEYQKPPEQIKHISVKINSNKMPTYSQKQKSPNTREPQIPFSSQQILKSPRDPKQVSTLNHTTGSESELNLNTYKSKNPQPQPINIKIDLKAMTKKLG
ncbi:unnamed protein product (macronuclear) [Paramecium tetraurelia]|uniref:FHA domain-containing protein n=1 Tax=Paramecium tetraurelia TaxID=5888 RepID=A0D001_PARTE|nr:uncharacterized protein GSPATT00011942001 [Paramecium tetraurelia]CAK76368.1 unnamed protein product [Paramecium tetraurelia]|eukprot:XP_001443765.1 hypothetical protein (macronuclear) [Paramecium tetraurelia strain d4-2]